jgi:hypothetical protein
MDTYKTIKTVVSPHAIHTCDNCGNFEEGSFEQSCLAMDERIPNVRYNHIKEHGCPYNGTWKEML